MIEAFVPAASTYAGDIDFLVNLIFWIVGFWFVLSELVFFYLIFRFRKRDGETGQYVTGEEKSQKRWITIPHILVLICDLDFSDEKDMPIIIVNARSLVCATRLIISPSVGNGIGRVFHCP